ncbi:PqqD family peptide modification chaperone [Nesterenkonia haasae]|uniref:PqqD family peptide modification chaperone n=1 Tax=Nesterenkonia haasae TaxID=2587813 RepID=UPI001391FAB3|nr:PqqD family peptide modification chaperone [Nesterenkonia haasae]NDK32457.1 PqqD family peptide modification chaperone [Nesterenkonia haasae]
MKSADGHAPRPQNSSAGLLLDIVQRRDSTSIGELTDALCSTYQIPRETAHRDVSAFVADAQQGGVLSYTATSSWKLLWGAALRQLPTAGLRLLYGSPSSGGLPRKIFYEPSASTLLALVAAISIPSAVLISGFISLVIVLFEIIMYGELSGQVLFLLGLASAAFVASMVVSNGVHELSHYRACRRLGVAVRHIYFDRFVVGIRRVSAKPAQDIHITLKGPLNGAVAALAVTVTAAFACYIATLLGLITGGEGIVVTLAAGVPALAQLMTALPHTADGQVIVQSFNQEREDYAQAG